MSSPTCASSSRASARARSAPVASSAAPSARGALGAAAAASYATVAGGDGDGVRGDGVVPLAAAHLEGATRQLTLTGAFHSINEPGTARPTAAWYGAEAEVDRWLGPLVDILVEAEG